MNREREDRPLPGPVRRLGFRFSGTAAHGACLVGDDHGYAVETWRFGHRRASSRRLSVPIPRPHRTQLTPTEDGRVLVVRSASGAHHVALLSHSGVGEVDETNLGVWNVPALRALPALDTDTLAWLVVVHDDATTALHRVEAGRPATVLPASVRVEGRLGGIAWLRPAGGECAVSVHLEDASSIRLMDVRRGTVLPAERGLRARTGTSVLLGSPERARALVAERTDEGAQLAWWSPHSGTRTPLPALTPAPSGAVRPLAVDPTGNRLAISVTEGARQYAAVLDTLTGSVVRIGAGEGSVVDAGWALDGLRLVMSTTVVPTTVVGPAHPPHYPLAMRAEPGAVLGAVQSFPGATGEVEAVTYGDWREQQALVVALHGGPEAAWGLAYDPTFQSLARGGVAVIAPNQRGSVGYGVAHRTAIRGAWGGPDLDDVLAILRSVCAARRQIGRPAPVTLGISYGAYLALLASRAGPDLMSGCVALAPFSSPRRLHGESSAAVRALLETQAGVDPGAGDTRWPDVLAPGRAPQSPVLVIQGRRDDVVPVRHVRRLVGDLRSGGAQVTYWELAGAGHDPLGEPGAQALQAGVLDFVSGVTGRPRLPLHQAGTA